MPSLLRGFSAPVKLSGIAPDRLRFLAAHDTDPFVRWESGQQYATQRAARAWSRHSGAARTLRVDPALIEAAAAALADADADPAFAAEALALPSEAFLADQMDDRRCRRDPRRARHRARGDRRGAARPICARPMSG